MRPVAKPNNPTTYVELPTTYIVKMNRPRRPTSINMIYTFFDATNWRALSQQVAPLTTQQKKDVTNKDFYVDKLSAYYGAARYDLLTALSAYCSYCGMPILDNSNAHVEHRMPKEWFPSRMLLWSNFLIACRDCNSRKSSRPTGDMGDQENDYAWPDVDVTTVNIRYALQLYTTGNVSGFDLTPTPIVGPTQPGNNTPLGVTVADFMTYIQQNRLTVKVGPVEGTTRLAPVNAVTLSIAFAPPLSFNCQVAVLMDGQTGLTNSTIRTLLSLNTVKTDSGVGDRRLVERTQAWFQAVDALSNTLLYAGWSVSNAVADALRDQINDTLVATGFWSVWVEVLIATGQTHVAAPMLANFLAMFTGAAFPNTDLTRV